MSSFVEIDFGERGEAPVIGIDLGTTNSLAAVMDLTGPRIIPGADGENLLPIVVHVAEAVPLVSVADRPACSTAEIIGH